MTFFASPYASPYTAPDPGLMLDSPYWRPAQLRGSVGGGAPQATQFTTALPQVAHQRSAKPGFFSYTYTDPGAVAGGGGYFPGHGAQSARNAAQNAEANFNQWRNSQGRQGIPSYSEVTAGGQFGGGGGNLANAFQSAQDEARAANESRYNDILTGEQARYERNMNRLAGMGAQEKADINERYDNEGSRINQDLVSRGLRNSTVAENMAMGNNRERTADLGRADERLRREQLTADAGLSADVLSFMERRTDSYPDVGLLAQLAQGLGTAGGGAAAAGLSAPTFADAGSLGFDIPAAAWGPMGGAFGPAPGMFGGAVQTAGNTFQGNQPAKDRYAAWRAQRRQELYGTAG